MNKWHNQLTHLSELGYQIMVDKQFNQNLHQLQLMMKILIKVMMAVIIKN
jgi:hypothetical protein